MKTDRELLELAAKAAGYAREGSQHSGIIWTMTDRNQSNWNPLTDDGDTLRLETRLKLTAIWEPMRDGWTIGGIVKWKGSSQIAYRTLAFHTDRKRATTTAAAAIGETL